MPVMQCSPWWNPQGERASRHQEPTTTIAVSVLAELKIEAHNVVNCLFWLIQMCRD
jgi:hypothetical protein